MKIPKNIKKEVRDYCKDFRMNKFFYVFSWNQTGDGLEGSLCTNIHNLPEKKGFRAWMAYSTFRNEFVTIKSANIRANNGYF